MMINLGNVWVHAENAFKHPVEWLRKDERVAHCNDALAVCAEKKTEAARIVWEERLARIQTLFPPVLIR